MTGFSYLQSRVVVGLHDFLIPPMHNVSMHREAIASYGLRPLAKFSIENNAFEIEIIDQGLAQQERCIYAFVIDGEIVRIGSSKASLRIRMGAWRRDVSKALQGRKSATPDWEALSWRKALSKEPGGIIYARPGSIVATPIGEISTYLDEECVLIARYRPKLNRSSR